MPNISTYLTRILEAVYGEDVRGSIHDAIAAINTALDSAIGRQMYTVDNTLTTSGAGADAKTVGDKALWLRGAIDGETDLNDLITSGIWYVSYGTSPLPGHWPFENGVSGRLIVFGSSSETYSTKAQIAISGTQMAWRYGTSFTAYGDWHVIASEDTSLRFASATSQAEAAVYDHAAANLPVPSLARVYFGGNVMTDCPGSWSAVAYILTIGVATRTQIMLFPSSGNIYARTWTPETEEAPTTFPMILGLSRFDGHREEVDLISYAYFKPASEPFDLADMPVNSIFTGNPSRFDPGENFTWSLGGSTSYTVTCAGNGQSAMRIYTVSSVSRREEFRGYKLPSSEEIVWFNFSPSGTSDMTNYVAIGASTTQGGSGDGRWTARPYPSWVAAMGGFSVTNLAKGGTDFVCRMAAGTSQNYMDVITDPENRDLFLEADLITVWVGINDQDVGVETGEPDDYYEFTGSETYEALKQNCTKAGAMNFVIKYVSEHFPRAQLMFVIGPRSPRFYPTPSISAGKITYTPSENQYSQEVAALAKAVCAAANVPVADASDTFGTVWNVGAKFTASSNKHPAYEDYDQYDKAIAAAIVAKYRN